MELTRPWSVLYLVDLGRFGTNLYHEPEQGTCLALSFWRAARYRGVSGGSLFSFLWQASCMPPPGWNPYDVRVLRTRRGYPGGNGAAKMAATPATASTAVREANTLVDAQASGDPR